MNTEAINYEWVNRWTIPIMWIMVGVAIICFALSIILAYNIDKKTTKDGGKDIKKGTYRALEVFYTAFIAIVSVFPLMGMLGTVSALISMNISGETESLKANFFQALNTTGLGLVLAIGCKLVNAFFSSYIEESIDKAKRLSERSDK